jgi:hypothetical protein
MRRLPRLQPRNSVVRMRPLARHVHHQRWTFHRLVRGLRGLWRRILASLATYFPPEEPQPSPPLAKAAALREGALLSESVDARSNKHVA